MNPPPLDAELGVVLKRWKEPYPGCDPSRIRSKEFQIVQLPGGERAFRKVDDNAAAIAHESEILQKLKDLPDVPRVLQTSRNSLLLTFLNGTLLPPCMPAMGFWNSLRIGHRMRRLLRQVHRKNIMHGVIFIIFCLNPIRRTWRFS